MNNKQYLTKLASTQMIPSYKNFYCDFETIILNNQHYVSCYSIVNENVSIHNSLKLTHINEVEYKAETLVSEFILKVIDVVKINYNNKNNYIFFFHNLNKFDSYFLLKGLGQIKNLTIKLVARNNQTYKILVSDKINNVKFEFRDTLLYLPISLDKICKIFCKFNSRNLFDYTENAAVYYLKNEEYQKELMLRCINNTMILHEGFENFLKYIRVNLNIEPLKSLSLPGISLYYFRLKFYNDNKFPIERLSKNKDQFIRKSYRGGIVDLFKPHLLNGFHYDVNSLYPYVMKNFPMPIGIGTWVIEISNIDEFFGFAKVEVTSPDYLHKPFLNYYDPNLGLISPLGTWTEVYFSEEIKYALTLGYKIKFINGISYKKDIIFNNFIDHLYTLRLKFEKGTSLNILFKLIMNSLYGKFGMRLDITESKFIQNEELKDYISFYDVKTVSTLNSKSLITLEKEPVLEKLNALLANNSIEFNQYLELKNLKLNSNTNSAVHIASAITAYGRIEIDKLKRDEKLDVYYSDTDSIFCQNPISSEYISDTELGKLKLENVVKEAIFLCPKVYMIKNANNETIIKCKGLDSKYIEDKDIYRAFYTSTNLFRKTVSHFMRDLKSFSIFRKEKNLQISADLRKRTKVIINGKWVDTRPLKI